VAHARIRCERSGADPPPDAHTDVTRFGRDRGRPADLPQTRLAARDGL